MQSHLTIITVTFNCETTIKDTLSSVRALKKKFPVGLIEYVVIDGLSTDRTTEIIRDSGVADYFVSEKDSGLYNAYNKGLRASSGLYVMFLNGDDFLNASFNELLKLSLEKKNMVLWACNNHIVDSHNRVVGKKVSIWSGLKYDMSICFPGLLIPRSAFSNDLKFDEECRISSDYQLVLRLFQSKTVHYEHFNKSCVSFRLGGVSTQIENELVRLRENLIARKCLPYFQRLIGALRDYGFVLPKKVVKWLIFR